MGAGALNREVNLDGAARLDIVVAYHGGPCCRPYVPRGRECRGPTRAHTTRTLRRRLYTTNAPRASAAAAPSSGASLRATRQSARFCSAAQRSAASSAQHARHEQGGSGGSGERRWRSWDDCNGTGRIGCAGKWDGNAREGREGGEDMLGCCVWAVSPAPDTPSSTAPPAAHASPPAPRPPPCAPVVHVQLSVSKLPFTRHVWHLARVLPPTPTCMVHSSRPAATARSRPSQASKYVAFFLRLRIMPGRTASVAPRATLSRTSASAACRWGAAGRGRGVRGGGEWGRGRVA